ncbi:MAG: LVIVD repeat-containing protein, partial [Candidatus Methylomirabilaceae bacterium]
PRTGPTQCHDITVYPAIGLAGGACGGYGLLLDIRDVANPKRIGAVADSNFAFWHSATFSNDGTKILFTDEWGGGAQPRCRVTDKHEWGANAIFTLADNTMTFQSYYKMSAPQTPYENCVAHNGSLIPIPGRDIMVQAWYQGGISVFEWTDPAHPKEIAYFDRGPMDSTKLVDGGSWSAYWYNGYIVSSEISRGLDVFELQPSGFISQNEIEAAMLVHFDFLNVQDQPKLVWPPSFAVPRAYLDQLARSNGLAPDRVAAARMELARAERLAGQARRDALTQLATQLNGEVQGAADQAKVRTMAAAVMDLATAQR